MTRTDAKREYRGAGHFRPASRPFAFLGLLLICGCALFEPRGSQHPDDGEDLDWRPPLSPDAVLQNLGTVVGALEPTLYEELLADSGWVSAFRFVGDEAASGGDRIWGLEEELGAWQRLTDQYNADQVRPTLQLMRTDSTLTGDSASYTADYWLQFPAAAGRAAAQYAGTLRLGLSRNQRTGDWAIHVWEDWGADSLSSWTQLKQAFLWP